MASKEDINLNFEIFVTVEFLMNDEFLFISAPAFRNSFVFFFSYFFAPLPALIRAFCFAPRPSR